MIEIRDGAELAAVLAQPGPLAWADGLFEREPSARCWFGWCTLDEVCAWAASPQSLRWVAGVLTHDPGAAETARLRAVVCREPDGAPLFGDDLPSPDQLPAGVIDRLLLASDCATGYRPPSPPIAPATVGGSLAPLLSDYVTRRAECVAGLLPQRPEAGLWVQPYDFATLHAAEESSWLAVPGGGAVRVDVLAWPALLSAALRSGPEFDAARLADEALVRKLPYGAARALIETADRLSELGGALPGVRFQRPAAAAGVDGAEPLAAATNRTVSQ